MIDREQASALLQEVAKRFQEVRAEYEKAEGILAGIEILTYVDQYPGFESAYFTVEQEYDDQNYYDQVSIELVFDEAAEGYAEACEQYGDPYDREELRYEYSQGGLERLFGYGYRTQLKRNDLRANIEILAQEVRVGGAADIGEL